MAGGVFLQQPCPVDNQFKLKPQRLGGLAAQHHALQEDFKILHHRAYFRGDFNSKDTELLFRVNVQVGIFHCIVYAVVDVGRLEVQKTHR